MEIRPLLRDRLKTDNQLRAQRLVPWPLLNAPFEGSWCVAAPGVSSGAHGHHEYEIWIALSGAAEIITEGERVPFVAGDIIHFTPETVHQLVNDSSEDFEMYSIWWDADLAGSFAERHRTEPSAAGAASPDAETGSRSA
ncbi:cupin domain-containing protein [Streptomyces sp. 8L]|uniref:cupin domain-containing protein n=1 Tax=Streptomyces sp. 8L TaxID=2877242 RepID=UPI001CD30919|nr:cupin domain-containing protein [Streptomyces sp. 8L]MCA1218415.1 cupin domain-containing protein [Streptomyces sp. 8L]